LNEYILEVKYIFLKFNLVQIVRMPTLRAPPPPMWKTSDVYEGLAIQNGTWHIHAAEGEVFGHEALLCAKKQVKFLHTIYKTTAHIATTHEHSNCFKCSTNLF
jgi:hypothetical protein